VPDKIACTHVRGNVFKFAIKNESIKLLIVVKFIKVFDDNSVVNNQDDESSLSAINDFLR
jgi:hypothetical protein